MDSAESGTPAGRGATCVRPQAHLACAGRAAPAPPPRPGSPPAETTGQPPGQRHRPGPAARAGALGIVILGPVRDLPRHRRARAARLLPPLLLRPLRSAPLLPRRLPPRQVIRARRHRGVPAVPRPRPRRRLQLLPQVSDHRLQRRDPLRLPAPGSAHHADPRTAPPAAHRSQPANHPRNHAQPPRQHRARRRNVTGDHSPQHQAQGPECLPQRVALGRSDLAELNQRPGPMTFSYRSCSTYVNSPVRRYGRRRLV